MKAVLVSSESHVQSCKAHNEGHAPSPLSVPGIASIVDAMHSLIGE